EVPAEERLEQVADPEVAEPAGGRAEHVVALPALRVGEDLVGLGDRFEPLRGVGRAVHVRVVLASQLPVGAADLLVRRRARDAEESVVIGLRCHLLSLSGGDGRRLPYWSAVAARNGGCALAWRWLLYDRCIASVYTTLHAC